MKTSALKINLLFLHSFLSGVVLHMIQEVITEKVPEGPGHVFLDPSKEDSQYPLLRSESTVSSCNHVQLQRESFQLKSSVGCSVVK